MPMGNLLVCALALRIHSGDQAKGTSRRRCTCGTDFVLSAAVTETLVLIDRGPQEPSKPFVSGSGFGCLDAQISFGYRGVLCSLERERDSGLSVR